MANFPNLDPELAAAVAMLPAIDFGNISDARATFDAMLEPVLADLSYEGVDLRLIDAPGLADDPKVPIRLFSPQNKKGPLPVLVWIHGGGFSVGTAESSDPYCLDICRELDIVVANVDYWLGPR